ncbi:MAG: 50S ribosomal protein L13 [Candidatus Shikimatogenerans bostrichidophilus]|nr:MAG: 50S ribosomal protein L13 [Candidatus Shikimatogenerans bostrichidophilus]
MKYLSLKTKFFFKKKKKKILLDASNQILGRFCSKIIKILIGKIYYNYTPNYSFVNKIIIINVDKIIINKKKIKKKKYYKYTGYIGNKKEYKMDFLYKKKPCFLVKKTIERMLPKNLIGKFVKKNIFIFKKNHNYLNNNNNIKYIDINSI